MLIISRIIRIGNLTRSNFGKLYCYSFATAFFIYVVVNMMMVLGLLPIVGSPLPIMSYGGSSMMAIMFGLGIVMSCKIYIFFFYIFYKQKEYTKKKYTYLFRDRTQRMCVDCCGQAKCFLYNQGPWIHFVGMSALSSYCKLS